MSPPATIREALIAELLGDLERVIDRADEVRAAVQAETDRTEALIASLGAAGETYRSAVLSFTDQAKQALQAYVARKGREHLPALVEEQRAALREAAAAALRSETGSASQALSEATAALSALSSGLRRHAARSRLIDVGVTALLSAVLTTMALLLIVPR